jgi:hypothetical protein
MTGWFSPSDGMFPKHPPLSIVRVEHFAEDFKILLARLDCGVTWDELDVATSALEAHSFQYHGVPPLSSVAIENLKSWFGADIFFYAQCESWLERHRA